MSNIPSRHRSAAVIRYLPTIQQLIANYPSIIVVDPAPYSPETFRARFRDAVRGVVEFDQGLEFFDTSKLDRLREIQSTGYSVVEREGQLHIGGREELKSLSAPEPVGTTVAAGLALPDQVDPADDEELDALVFLSSRGYFYPVFPLSLRSALEPIAEKHDMTVMEKSNQLYIL